ncbi:hypothetical protein DD238_006606 [Peronospora effusa]|uniref:Protein kinase domain-containing protein n=1 Tax=Peronospora effusa TaxID=542832 RepID=A0A3M6VIA0_9STRA|nr:hypothetical protein DD238_006606 [Peronospora effusa]
MDAWGSQNAAASEQRLGEEEEWEMATTGKDALIVLLDVRKAMFSSYPHAAVDAPSTWFHAVVELMIKLLKSKVVASDNSLLSLIFFGTNKRGEAGTLEQVYEFQPLGYPSAQRIKELHALLESDVQSAFGSMENSENFSFSNALWQCGISFSNAKYAVKLIIIISISPLHCSHSSLKKKDSQRIWIFTNDDSSQAPDTEEVDRIQKQVQNHTELKRTLNFFYITPPGKKRFELAKFYGCSFKDLSADFDEEAIENEAYFQPAFPVGSLDDLMDGSLRKRFRKRRLTTIPLHITKGVSIGVELYALVIVQRKNTPVALDASTNTPLKVETKWLCEDTGAYLTPDQIKKYIDFGGKRVYFTRDDLIEIKHYDAPGLQLICFKPVSALNWNENIRSPYFVYPSDGYIEGSSTAFMAILNSMLRKQKFALARLIARKTSEPRLVALVPQEEANDEMGQVQPSGFNVIFLPYLDDIRDVSVETVGNIAQEKIDAAKHLIAKLKLTEAPSFENPDLQKHYAAIQALALDEEELEFDEKKDTTLPDAEGFDQDEVKGAIADFREVCGGELLDASTKTKRKLSAPGGRKATIKKSMKGGLGELEAKETFDRKEWAALVNSNAIQKKTVAQLKAFLQAHGLVAVGRKADLINATLGGLVGSNATGGLPFSIDTPSMDGNVAASGAAGESVVFEGLSDFVLHSGKSKQDPSHAVSIFKSRQPAGQLTQNALRRIKTLRHPNILAYLDGTEVPNNGPVIIVTEHVMPLADFLMTLRMEYGVHSSEFSMCVSWGLRSILMALQFVNVDCKLIHGRLAPQSIFVTKGGDWKLGGFELTAEITSDGPSYMYTAFQQYADTSYKSPECQRCDWKAVATGPPYGIDIWAFACLMYYVFNDGHFRSSDVSSAANIPPTIRTQYRKAIDDKAARRPSPRKMLNCSYFDTAFIKRMNFLENLAVKESDEKAAFYKELCANLEMLPRCFGVHKILPALKQVVEFGAAPGAKNGLVKLDPSASHMLPAMVQIGSSLSAEEFKAEVLPIIIKLFSCNDRAVRVQLLQMMEKFAVHFDEKLVNSLVVFDNLCSGFTDAAPVLRELTVKSMLHIADKLSESNLNNRVMKYFAKLQSDPEPAIRTNTTICLGKIASKLNDTTRPKVLFPAFAKALRDSFPHARLAGLRSITACQVYFTPQSMASSIVPAISPLLLDVSTTVRDQAKISLDSFMKKIMDEAAHMKTREELDAKEYEAKRILGESDHVGDAVACGTTSSSSNDVCSSSGYVSSLTAWASSAVASNVDKLVGCDGSLSARSTLGASIGTSSLRSSFLSGIKIQDNDLSSSASSSSSSTLNSFNAFSADETAAGNGWGDDADLDGLESPKRTRSGIGSSLSVNHGATSSSTSPAASSLSELLSLSTTSVKLSVSRKPGTNQSSFAVQKTPSSSTFAMNAADTEWGDDKWGVDDDLDLNVLTLKANRRSPGFQKDSNGLSKSSLSTTATIAPVAPAGLSPERKTVRERRAEAAHAKSKVKHQPLGAMKLDSTNKEKTDDWNWDF